MNRKKISKAKAERLRRILLGDLRLVLRYRYQGDVLTEDDGGYEDLVILLELVSLGDDPRPKMEDELARRAPWMDAANAKECIDTLLKMPWRQRKRHPYSIGKLLGLTWDERERLKVWSIMPCDLTAPELEEKRKMKDRERTRRNRIKRGARSRREYEGNSLSKTKPWEAEGICRRTWERRRDRRVASATATNILTGPDTLATPAPSGTVEGASRGEPDLNVGSNPDCSLPEQSTRSSLVNPPDGLATGNPPDGLVSRANPPDGLVSRWGQGDTPTLEAKRRNRTRWSYSS